MSLFAIADTHLSFGTDKPMDTFEGWQNYTERLKSNWNKVVCDKDTVVIAGDISWAMDFKELKADFDFIEENDLRTKAKFLAVDIDVTLFRKWNSYNSIKEPIEDIIALMKKRRNDNAQIITE